VCSSDEALRRRCHDAATRGTTTRQRLVRAEIGYGAALALCLGSLTAAPGGEAQEVMQSAAIFLTLSTTVVVLAYALLTKDRGPIGEGSVVARELVRVAAVRSSSLHPTRH
jgi:hypothetical protein